MSRHASSTATTSGCPPSPTPTTPSIRTASPRYATCLPTWWSATKPRYTSSRPPWWRLTGGSTPAPTRPGWPTMADTPGIYVHPPARLDSEHGVPVLVIPATDVLACRVAEMYSTLSEAYAMGVLLSGGL